ncbi:hypothetical protein M0813_19197 [Anaeramoeba flamelloides]|uniref:Uncharacterized protein n=1 Tax=Anaeramoeba flamelloides TaxID=1746091 RepID=A0ABQ8YPK1_9EUKA|nr:hypothetical protein M0813_19197 [Anaeramoeba flamelloides]
MSKKIFFLFLIILQTVLGCGDVWDEEKCPEGYKCNDSLSVCQKIRSEKPYIIFYFAVTGGLVGIYLIFWFVYKRIRIGGKSRLLCFFPFVNLKMPNNPNPEFVNNLLTYYPDLVDHKDDWDFVENLSIGLMNGRMRQSTTFYLIQTILAVGAIPSIVDSRDSYSGVYLALMLVLILIFLLRVYQAFVVFRGPTLWKGSRISNYCYILSYVYFVLFLVYMVRPSPNIINEDYISRVTVLSKWQIFAAVLLFTIIIQTMFIFRINVTINKQTGKIMCHKKHILVGKYNNKTTIYRLNYSWGYFFKNDQNNPLHIAEGSDNRGPLKGAEVEKKLLEEDQVNQPLLNDNEMNFNNNPMNTGLNYNYENSNVNYNTVNQYNNNSVENTQYNTNIQSSGNNQGFVNYPEQI